MSASRILIAALVVLTIGVAVVLLTHTIGNREFYSARDTHLAEVCSKVPGRDYKGCMMREERNYNRDHWRK